MATEDPGVLLKDPHFGLELLGCNMDALLEQVPNDDLAAVIADAPALPALPAPARSPRVRVGRFQPGRGCLASLLKVRQLKLKVFC